MSKYVMSDIHGCFKDFTNMLKVIDFSDSDTLYILGDIFDRGPEPLKVYDYIIKRSNIILIKGNHEKLLEDALRTKDYLLWYCNGGHITHTQILASGPQKLHEIYTYVKNLPLIKVVNKFILVHAGLSFPKDYNSLTLEQFLNQDESTCIWNRDNINNEKQYKDYTIICGHTPVQNISKEASQGNPEIIKRKGTIYIDCGCCFKEAKGILACLRLDDMQEYYVW